MAAMERVDSPDVITRCVFIGAAISSLVSASFLLFGKIIETEHQGFEINLATIGMLADGSFAGFVLLTMSLMLLWPSYLALMSAVGMWQSRERLLAGAAIVVFVLLSIMVSSWQWIRNAEIAGDTWSVGFGLIGIGTGLVAFLGFWRAGLWLLDSPYRE